jgi:uncharacterized membrane protein YebE (DUF533 family)
MLFNIVADMLDCMIAHAKSDGLIEGVVSHLVDGGLSILQYADDTIIFMEHGKSKKLEVHSVSVQAIIGSKEELP